MFMIPMVQGKGRLADCAWPVREAPKSPISFRP
jgi:hypothetical protein